MVVRQGDGRALPCTRDFFVKKSSKNFISAAAGIGAFLLVYAQCPARQKDGGRGGFMRYIFGCGTELGNSVPFFRGFLRFGEL